MTEENNSWNAREDEEDDELDETVRTLGNSLLSR